MKVLVLFSGFHSQHFALPVTNQLDILDDSGTDPHDPPVCTSVLFVSALWSEPSVPVCRPEIMEGVMKNQTSPRIYTSHGGTGTHFSGPNKLVYKYTNLIFRCFAPAEESVQVRSR
jgi:hypothetical protein